MNAMDKLFELYNEYFDRLENAARRLDEKFPLPSRNPLKRKTREEFEDYLLNGVDSAWKRSFLVLVLDGHHELYPTLPDYVKKTLARDAA